MNPVEAPSLPRPRDVLRTFGIYVHVPFCSHRCWYCDFNAYAGLDQMIEAYMDALVLDARTAASAGADIGPRPVVTSVFVGGGTPSLVPASSVAAVLDAIRESWPVSPDVEITCEANPESAAPELLRAWRDAGVNRVSFGVQALDGRLLAALGRVHDVPMALRALTDAMDVFDRVSADLIVGIPGENDRTVLSGVRRLAELGLSHVSCYTLTYEDGTPLAAWRRLGKVIPEPEDDVARRWEAVHDVLESAGLQRYEVSNWARPGQECRHNELYWRCGEYLGVGAGAHGHLATPRGSVRSWTVKAPERYIRAVAEGKTVAGAETIDADGRCAELMFCGLRRSAGVDASYFRAVTGEEMSAVFGPQLDRWAALDMLTWDGRTAALTERGTMLANEVVASFLPG